VRERKKKNMAALATIGGVTAEIERLDKLLDGSISEAREVAIRTQITALYGNLTFLQQKAAQQGKKIILF